MFVLFTARLNPRRNPAKVPAAMLTRSTLDALGKAFSTGMMVPDTNPDAAVLRDYMLDLGIETLPDVPAMVPGSNLHRWSVLDAIQSAESVPLRAEAKTVTALARAWVDDPSRSNAKAAANAAESLDPGGTRLMQTADDLMDGAAAAPAWSAEAIIRGKFAFPPDDCPYRLSAFFASLVRSASKSAPRVWSKAGMRSADRSMEAASLRIRVLAALIEAGVLPEPPKLNTRS
jgi:hypothetical protein